MGQQQLLLLVLGIVIVGLAIVVGINAFSEARVKSNADALVTDALRMSSDAQDWKQKPQIFGGSPDTTKADPDDFSALTFTALAYSGDRVCPDQVGYENVNGFYNLFPTSNGLLITASNAANQNQLYMTVTGTLEASVSLDDDLRVVGGYKLDGTPSSVTAPESCGDWE